MHHLGTGPPTWRHVYRPQISQAQGCKCCDDRHQQSLLPRLPYQGGLQVASAAFSNGSWTTGLAEQFQQTFDGPNVSDKVPTSRLAQEYANSDTSYGIKSQNLALTHDLCRRIAPDGNCGWSALLYGYLEVLLALRNAQLVDREHARFKALLPATCNYDEMMQDLAEPLPDLFDQLKQWVSLDDAERRLLATFNDSARGHLIYAFRLFTAGHMRQHADDFAPYVVDDSLEAYIGTSVLGIDQEMDHVSLTAAYQVLLNPSGIGFTVYSLNPRSPGDQVDIAQEHEANPMLVGGAYTPLNPPMVRVLFRPTHYDLVYKKPVQNTVQVHIACEPDLPMPMYPATDYGSISFLELLDTHGWGSNSTLSNTLSHSHQARGGSAGYQCTSGTSHPQFQDTPHFSAQIPEPIAAQGGQTEMFLNPALLQEPREERPTYIVPRGGSPLLTKVMQQSNNNRNHFDNGNFAPEQWIPEQHMRNDPSRQSARCGKDDGKSGKRLKGSSS